MTRPAIQPYANSWEHLLAELGCLELLVRREAQRFKQAARAEPPEIFRGMFISDGEIEQLLGEMSAPPPVAETNEAAAWLGALTRLRGEIALRRQASLERGVHLSLPRLAHLFGLTPFEEQIALICLAPELDGRYEKLYAYLQDDVTRRKPGVELILRLLCATPQERLGARACFSPQAPLLRAQILRFPDGDEHSLPARPLRLDEQVVNYLLGAGGVSQELAACCRLLAAHDDLQSLRWPDSLKTRLVEVTRNHLQVQHPATRRLIHHFYGPQGTGKKTLAGAICREIGASLLVVDLREVALRAPRFEETLRRILREGLLQPAAIYLEHFDQLIGDEPEMISRQQVVARAIDEFSWLTFIAAEKSWEPRGLFKDHLFLSVELPAPDSMARAELWATLAAGQEGIALEADWGDLAVKFRLTPGQMQDALIAARNHAQLREGGDQAATPAITMNDLHLGCRRQSNRKLNALARKLTPRKGWADITLPPHALAQLREICAQVKHRQTVYGCWGFGEKQTLGKGLCALFYGLSGTGKTLAVEVLAHELSLEAFKIDLSTVVSKYIGETEKNLSKVFAEAETSNAILFFDEADALFGKRSEVRDAHDRYANIEINYLLQRMEEFDGLVILATNLRKNIDEAFFRRMHFAVEFPFPDEGHRYRIWRQHLPDAAPVADDIDFDFLAGRLSLSGGNIRNVVINAAFLAAANSGVIHMEHFIRAARREYEKIGRLCTEAEFAPYHVWL
jgi:AAA+ superfamily predicted ATPase